MSTVERESATATIAHAGASAEIDRSEHAQMFANRAATYELLGRLFRQEVDEDLLNRMRAMRYPQQTGSNELDEGYRLIAGYLSNVQAPSLTELAVDYVHAFLGHGNDGQGAAYPYESVYTSGEHLLMQDARDEVVAIYRANGLDRADSWKDPEDHVALELEFMGTLSRRCADIDPADDAFGHLVATQRAFLEDHLLSWVPPFARDMRRFARTDFYRGLACLTEGFLSVDRAFLAALADTAGLAETGGRTE